MVPLQVINFKADVNFNKNFTGLQFRMQILVWNANQLESESAFFWASQTTGGLTTLKAVSTKPIKHGRTKFLELRDPGRNDKKPHAKISLSEKATIAKIDETGRCISPYCHVKITFHQMYHSDICIQMLNFKKHKATLENEATHIHNCSRNISTLIPKAKTVAELLAPTDSYR